MDKNCLRTHTSEQTSINTAEKIYHMAALFLVARVIHLSNRTANYFCLMNTNIGVKQICFADMTVNRLAKLRLPQPVVCSFWEVMPSACASLQGLNILNCHPSTMGNIEHSELDHAVLRHSGVNNEASLDLRG